MATGPEDEKSGRAHLSVYVGDQSDSEPIIVPTDDNTTIADLGAHVPDCVEEQSEHTIPEEMQKPGQTAPLGLVHWDGSEFPTKLELESGVVVKFTTLGGIAAISRPDAEDNARESVEK